MINRNEGVGVLRTATAWVKWFFGSRRINCSCNKRRKDGYHNLSCASWQNAPPNKRFIPIKPLNK